MGKKQENKMLIPPDGGEWTFVMKSGRTHRGDILVRYDDGVIIKVDENLVAALRTEEIETMWQGDLPQEEEKPKGA